MAEAKSVAIINVEQTRGLLHARILAAVNDMARQAYDQARRDVPVRKIFRYGRTKAGLRVQGRQDVQTLSLASALGQQGQTKALFLAGLSPEDRASAIRRGVGSPFPTNAAGRRIPGSQSLVETAQISDSYRSRNRANQAVTVDRKGETSVDLTRREVVQTPGGNRLGRLVDVERGIQRFVPNLEAEADLSARGRYELKRATGTVGGALLKSIEIHEASDGRRMTAFITAGGGDVDYAKYVEFGTRRSRAQPFMRPAKAMARVKYPDVMREHLRGS